MGATIQVYRECLGGTPCRFGRRNFMHSAVIAGPSKLHAADLVIPDLRAGFSHLIAALAAEGTSRVYGVEPDQPRLRGLRGASWPPSAPTSNGTDVTVDARSPVSPARLCWPWGRLRLATLLSVPSLFRRKSADRRRRRATVTTEADGRRARARRATRPARRSSGVATPKRKRRPPGRPSRRRPTGARREADARAAAGRARRGRAPA